MKLIRLACAMGVILVSGGCAENLTAPPQAAAAPRAQASSPGELRIYAGGHWGQPSQPISLFVVDGVPVSRDDLRNSALKPEDIETLTILKGPRAIEAFGVTPVLVVTTRR